jgi:tRNA(fMet)-specific endonuclease VapC
VSKVYLLDTNIVTDLVRNPQGKVAARIADVGQANVCTSVIVAAELRFGATKRGSARLSTQLDLILGTMSVLPTEAPVDEIYGRIRTDLERVGQPIGSNDFFIAAHALATGRVLVSDNVAEFARVKGLTLENWIR